MNTLRDNEQEGGSVGITVTRQLIDGCHVSCHDGHCLGAIDANDGDAKQSHCDAWHIRRRLS